MYREKSEVRIFIKRAVVFKKINFNENSEHEGCI